MSEILSRTNRKTIYSQSTNGGTSCKAHEILFTHLNQFNLPFSLAIFHVFATPPISIVPWNLYIYSFIWKISCKNHMIYIDHRMIEKICEILVQTYLYHKCKYSWKHDNELKNICPYDGLESTLRNKEILNVRTAFYSLHLIIDFTKKVLLFE